MDMIFKAARIEKAAVGEHELALINAQALRALSADEVFTFRFAACDNQVDRDCERFTDATLEQLAKLYVGKPVLRDHMWSAGAQTARVYDAQVVSEGEVKRLVLSCYMVRTASTADTIAAIEGGILRECSVGCAVERSVCSICGADRRNGDCGHKKGERYDGALCFTRLMGASDAYEFSFVAVPAQPRAGVVKRFGSEGTELRMLRKQAELGQRYLTGLRREVVRLAMLADGHLDGKIFTKAVGRLDEAELLELKRAYEAQIAKKFPVAPQLRQQAETKREDDAVFLV